jgi:hypothetical protein
MMSGVSLETCWAIKKHWNNKFYYTLASCWLLLYDLYFLVCVFWEAVSVHNMKKVWVEVQPLSVLISTGWKWVAGFTPVEYSAVPIDCAFSVVAIKLGLWVTPHVVELRVGILWPFIWQGIMWLCHYKGLLKAAHINRIGIFDIQRTVHRGIFL